MTGVPVGGVVKLLPVLSVLLLASLALAGCSGTKDTGDDDQDGLFNGVERNGYTIYVDLVGERVERTVKSDPDVVDTDGDGINDYTEYTFYPPMDASNPDTDGDGLTDCQEALHTVVSECQDPDFAGPYDGGYNTDPTKADSDRGPTRYVAQTGYIDHTGTLGTGPITWGDGIADGVEVAGYDITVGEQTRHVTTSPNLADSDDDGLEDGEEVLLYGSDPTVQDTDGDGCRDGSDVFPDHADTYRLTVDRFIYNGSSSGNVAFSFLLGNAVERAPQEDYDDYPHGQVVETGVVSEEFPFEGCPTTPYRSSVFLQFFAIEPATGRDRNLDIFSTTGPDATIGGGRGWWDPRADLFSWDDGLKSPMPKEEDGTLHWSGTEGEVWFHIDALLS